MTKKNQRAKVARILRKEVGLDWATSHKMAQRMVGTYGPQKWDVESTLSCLYYIQLWLKADERINLDDYLKMLDRSQWISCDYEEHYVDTVFRTRKTGVEFTVSDVW